MRGDSQALADVVDDELVRRILSGERELFAEIVRRFHRAVWGVVSARLGDKVGTENLVQESFVRAFASLARYESGRDLGRWVKAIARNLVNEELRRSSREGRRMAHYRDYLMALHEDERQLEEREGNLERAVTACRESLAEPSRHAMHLFYEQALGLSEVAAAIGRSVVATRQLLFRARVAIRACVEKRLAVE